MWWYVSTVTIIILDPFNQPAITYWKLTVEALEQGEKHVKS